MGRKSIFELLDETYDLHEEIKRIDNMFNTDMFNFNSTYYTPESLVDIYIFHTWKQRRSYLNVDDMKEVLNIDNIVIYRSPEIDDILIYIEFIQNIMYLCLSLMKDNDQLRCTKEYGMIIKNISILLDKINHETYYFEDDEMALVVEKNATATLAAELVDEDKALKIIQYNHHLLKGDLSRKRDILLTLADDFEPKRALLENSVYKDLASDLGFMLNNINIRHNNIEGAKKKEYVASLSNDVLEQLYDKTYDLLLTSIITHDYINNAKDLIADLKIKVNS